MKENYKKQSGKTAGYYDKLQQGYNDVYGNIIQAFRPTSDSELIQAIIAGADLHDGLRIVDAGCGIGGPALLLAAANELHIVGITISQVQVKEAQTNIAQKQIRGKVEVIHGDFHELSQLVAKNSFDRVLFLESLGHAGEPDIAIAESFQVLKPGGSIYIKDFYYKETHDPYWQGRITKTIDNINRFYSYNSLNLNDTIRSLRTTGFEIDFIRRFNFKDDISIRLAFENRFGIDIFGGEPEFAPAEWLEIKCTKPLI